MSQKGDGHSEPNAANGDTDGHTNAESSADSDSDPGILDGERTSW